MLFLELVLFSWSKSVDLVIQVYTDPDEQMPQAAATTSSTQDIAAANIGEINELILV